MASLCAVCSFSVLAGLPPRTTPPTATAPKISIPPSAVLDYTLNAQQNGFALQGEARLTWFANKDRYRVVGESTTPILGKVLETSSEGVITQRGLAPRAFIEKRFRKDPSTTTFDAAQKKIHFSNSTEQYPLAGGEQDRSSVVWQLAAMARAAPDKFKAGSVWRFFVAGTRDAEPWTFTVVKHEPLTLPQGTINSVHLFRSPPPDAKGQQLDVWLAPSLEHYPVRLRFADGDGNVLEQSLSHIKRGTP